MLIVCFGMSSNIWPSCHVNTLSLALALTLACLNPKVPNPYFVNPNPPTVIQPMNLIKDRLSSKIWGVSVHVMSINEVVLTKPQN